MEDAKDYIASWEEQSAAWVLEKYWNGELLRDVDRDMDILLACIERDEKIGELRELVRSLLPCYEFCECLECDNYDQSKMPCPDTDLVVRAKELGVDVSGYDATERGEGENMGEMRDFCKKLEDAARNGEPVELWGVTYVPKEGAGHVPTMLESERAVAVDALGKCVFDHVFMASNLRDLAHAIGVFDGTGTAGAYTDLNTVRDRLVYLLSDDGKPSEEELDDRAIGMLYRQLKRALGDVKNARDVLRDRSASHRRATMALESENSRLAAEIERKDETIRSLAAMLDTALKKVQENEEGNQS